MKDLTGKYLAIGDRVAFNPPAYKGLVLATITGFTPKMVELSYRGGQHTVAVPENVVRVTP